MRTALMNTLLFRRGPTLEKTLGKVCGQSKICYSTRKGHCSKPICGKPKCGKTIRGCLPWETQEYKKCLQRKITDDIKECKDCKSPELVQKLTLSVCELRRLERCMKAVENPAKCRHITISQEKSDKIYPMIHADRKDYIPGCPMPGWQKLNKNYCS